MWAPDYLTLTQGKDYLRVPLADDVDDPYISALITASSRAIDRRCLRQFGTEPGTRVYEGADAVPDLVHPGWWLLVVDDMRADTAVVVTVGGAALPATGYVRLPRNAPADKRPYTGIRLAAQPFGDVEIATGFGWEAPPAQVGVACRFQLGRWHVRRESPFGVAGSPSDGSETRLLARLDPDVATSLAGLARTQAPR
jgi:hypothetical protein